MAAWSSYSLFGMHRGNREAKSLGISIAWMITMPQSKTDSSRLPAVSPSPSSIEPFIHRRVTVMHTDSPLSDVAQALREKSIGCVLVSDHEGYIVGVATDRDLACRGYGEGLKPSEPLIRVMTPQPIFVEPSATLDEVVWQMEANGIRRIPVLQPCAKGRLRAYGMLTLDDLIAAQKIDDYRMTRIVQSQVLRRMGEFAHERGRVLHMIDRKGRAVTETEALSKFYDQVFEKARIDHLGLPRAQAITGLTELWETLVGRLHHTGAMHLISSCRSTGADAHPRSAPIAAIRRRGSLGRAPASGGGPSSGPVRRSLPLRDAGHLGSMTKNCRGSGTSCPRTSPATARP